MRLRYTCNYKGNYMLKDFRISSVFCPFCVAYYVHGIKIYYKSNLSKDTENSLSDI